VEKDHFRDTTEITGCEAANFSTNPFQVQLLPLQQQEQQAHLLQQVLHHLPLQALLQAFPDLEETQENT
jgi:hypothetical protein